ncbi:peptidoglycan-binding domain-containing protein [Streptomyces sp. NPDC046876]|uniref:peptidoglycan-binding domain-containing protein n=1 Tax=Streptomyces sp. NPDC046876 TaxID=3155616 RepID=UPI00340EDEE2
MSHHPDESGPDPVEPPLVRPYLAPTAAPTEATAPSEAAAPLWPQDGPFDREPGQAEPAAPVPAADPVPGSAPAPARDGRRSHARGRERSGLLPWAALVLVLLGAAGGLVFLLGGPEPEPEAPAGRPDLSIPQLPARSIDAEPSTQAPVRKSAPASPSTSPSPSAKPTPQTSAPAPAQAAAKSGTLRMGDRGAEVSALQQRLYGQGFTYVSVTGVYDGQTKRGVAQLQRDRDIKGDPTGVYGPATRAAFGI